MSFGDDTLDPSNCLELEKETHFRSIIKGFQKDAERWHLSIFWPMNYKVKVWNKRTNKYEDCVSFDNLEIFSEKDAVAELKYHIRRFLRIRNLWDEKDIIVAFQDGKGIPLEFFAPDIL